MSRSGLRVLVTNDDGIAAPGLAALAAAVAALGHDVVVAAPATDHSGASSAIGPMGGPDGVAVTPVELDAVPDVPAFAVDAPPALIVIIGRLGAFGDAPDVVVSGINPGPNTGRSTLHSGTVGAARCTIVKAFSVPLSASFFLSNAVLPHLAQAFLRSR